MSHFSRLPSAVRMNAPLRVPTKTRTPLIDRTSRFCGRLRGARIFARNGFQAAIVCNSLLLTESGRTGEQNRRSIISAVPSTSCQCVHFLTSDTENSAHRQHHDQTARAVRAHHENFFYVRGAARPGDETKKIILGGDAAVLEPGRCPHE